MISLVRRSRGQKIKIICRVNRTPVDITAGKCIESCVPTKQNSCVARIFNSLTSKLKLIKLKGGVIRLPKS